MRVFILAVAVAVLVPAIAQAQGWKAPIRPKSVPFAVRDSLLYASDQDGGLVAIHLATGEELWRFQVGDSAQASPIVTTNETSLAGMMVAGNRAAVRKVTLRQPIAGGRAVYLGSRHKAPESLPNFYALDAITGDELWSLFTLGGTFIAPLSWNDRVVVAGEHVVHALDRMTGDELWTFEPLAGMHKNARRNPTAMIEDGGTIYLSVWPTHWKDTPRNSYLHAVDAASGARLWTVEVPGNQVTAPAVSDGFVYFAVLVGQDALPDNADGSVILRRGARDVKVLSVERSTGSQAWEAVVERARSVGSPIRCCARPGNGRHALDLRRGQAHPTHHHHDHGWRARRPCGQPPSSPRCGQRRAAVKHQDEWQGSAATDRGPARFPQLGEPARAI